MMFQGFRKKIIRIAGQRGSALALARGRLVLMGTVFALAYLALFARAAELSLLRGALWGAEAETEDFAFVESAPPRADIVDSNGVLLATTLEMESLYADPALVSDPAAAALALAQIFPDMDVRDMAGKLGGRKRFVWVRRNVTPAEQQAVLRIGEPGLQFQREGRRVYPQGNLAAHILGYTNVDGDGLAGIERSFDAALKEGAAPLRLTLDVRLQHALRRELAAAITEFEAIGGAGLILDVETGAVLAGVSLPDFDPHNPGAARAAARFNRLTLGVYEMGSLFKIFSTAALLEMTDTALSTRFDVREPLKTGRFIIRDYHPEKRKLTVPEAFIHSSNIASALMGEKVGTDSLRGFYRDLGLLDSLQTDIEEIGAPLVPDPWREVNTLTASYGHGLATTPLQVGTGVASIVNGGFLVRPYFVEKPSETDKNKAIRIVSENVSETMQKLLRLAVTDGTGSFANVPGYAVGGKTGTAEKSVGGRYDRDKLISSFAGIFPADAPRYAVLVMVDEPKGQKESFGYATAGWVAAPAVARVVASMGSILGLPVQSAEEEEIFTASLRRYVQEKDKKEAALAQR